MSQSPFLSIVIPVHNEADWIPGLTAHLNEVEDVIIVDGGSTDETLSLLTSNTAPQQGSAVPGGLKVKTATRGRAVQMNAGAAAAVGDVLLFLHADTLLPPGFMDELSRFNESGKPWGRFNVRFDDNRPIFRLVAFMINWRSRITGICTGDQAIFMRREVFEALHGFANIPLMEDIELSKRLKSLAMPFCIASPVTTSVRRWRTHGISKTIMLMWWLRLQYFLGVPPEKLVQQY